MIKKKEREAILFKNKLKDIYKFNKNWNKKKMSF